MKKQAPDLTVKEVCNALSLSHSAVWRQIMSGGIKAHRIGRAVRIQQSELDRLRLEKQIVPYE